MRRMLIFSTVVLYSLLAVLIINADLPYDNDEPWYYLLARSLHQGMGYSDIFYPGEPPHVTYPFMYPLILCAGMYISCSVIFLKSLNILFGIGLLVLLIIYLGSDNIAVLTVFLTSVSLWLVNLSALFLSEVPYIFFTVLSFYLFRNYIDTRLSLRSVLLLVLPLLSAYFTKNMGIFIFLAMVGYLVYKRQRRKALWLVLFWLPLPIVWAVRNSLQAPGTVSVPYMSQLLAYCDVPGLCGYLRQIAFNSMQYVQAIPRILIPGYFLGEMGFEGASYFISLYASSDLSFKILDYAKPSLAISIIMWSFVFIGIYKKARDHGAMALYIIIFLVFNIFFWPARAAMISRLRYMFVLLPFLIYCFLQGVSSMRNRAPIYISAVIIFAYNFFPSLEAVRSNISYMKDYDTMTDYQRYSHHPFWYADYFLLCPWIRDNTDSKSIVMHHFPPGFYLYSGRKSVFFHQRSWSPAFVGIDEIKRTIRDKNVDYLVVQETPDRGDIHLLPAISKEFKISLAARIDPKGEYPAPVALYSFDTRRNHDIR